MELIVTFIDSNERSNYRIGEIGSSLSNFTQLLPVGLKVWPYASFNSQRLVFLTSFHGKIFRGPPQPFNPFFFLHDGLFTRNISGQDASETKAGEQLVRITARQRLL